MYPFSFENSTFSKWNGPLSTRIWWSPRTQLFKNALDSGSSKKTMTSRVRIQGLLFSKTPFCRNLISIRYEGTADESSNRRKILAVSTQLKQLRKESRKKFQA